MGRAVEAGLRPSAMKYIDKPTGALQFAVGRSKTRVVQNLHAFCDRDSWEADIFHAKACHLATSSCIDDSFQFKVVNANVINKILTRVSAKSDPGYTTTTKPPRFQSHSGRRGCASEALAHSGVSVTEVITRGGWSFDAVSRVFM